MASSGGGTRSFKRRRRRGETPFRLDREDLYQVISIAPAIFKGVIEWEMKWKTYSWIAVVPARQRFIEVAGQSPGVLLLIFHLSKMEQREIQVDNCVLVCSKNQILWRRKIRKKSIKMKFIFVPSSKKISILLRSDPQLRDSLGRNFSNHEATLFYIFWIIF